MADPRPLNSKQRQRAYRYIAERLDPDNSTKSMVNNAVNDLLDHLYNTPTLNSAAAQMPAALSNAEKQMIYDAIIHYGVKS